MNELIMEAQSATLLAQIAFGQLHFVSISLALGICESSQLLMLKLSTVCQLLNAICVS